MVKAELPEIQLRGAAGPRMSEVRLLSDLSPRRECIGRDTPQNLDTGYLRILTRNERVT